MATPVQCLRMRDERSISTASGSERRYTGTDDLVDSFKPGFKVFKQRSNSIPSNTSFPRRRRWDSSFGEANEVGSTKSRPRFSVQFELPVFGFSTARLD
jgi:hypothetical protein